MHTLYRDELQHISSTAHITNYLRTWYQEQGVIESLISSAVHSEDIFHALGGRGDEEEFALFLAARYHVLSREISRRAFSQVLELAGGLSPRGLESVAGGDAMCYIETDMPEMIKQKKVLVDALLPIVANSIEREGGAGKYTLHAMDSTDEKEFNQIVVQFSNAPVGVITEGLLPYLYRDDLDWVCKNIYNLLKLRGGIWVTDIITRTSLQNPIFIEEASKKLITTFYRTAAIDQKKLAFENPGDVINFFHSRGFSFERVSADGFLPLKKRALERGLSEQRIDALLSLRAFFVLSLQK